MSKETMLVKYLAQSGIASRRKVVQAIKDGLVTVNGEIITEPWFNVTDKDTIKYENRIVKPVSKYIYILLNKPVGYITTVSDPQGRPTVLDLVKKYNKQRIYPVGRLDKDTSGVLLLTNDGQLTQKLAHPRYNVKKVYQVLLDRPFSQEDAEKLKKGVRLQDGVTKIDSVSWNKRKVRVALHSGKNRVVRRLFAKLGYHILKLDRIEFAGLKKKGIVPGAFRLLTKKEVESIKRL